LSDEDFARQLQEQEDEEAYGAGQFAAAAAAAAAPCIGFLHLTQQAVDLVLV
jgi:hypothetical protein